MTDPQQPAPFPPPAAPAGHPAPPIAPPSYQPPQFLQPNMGAYQAPPGAFSGPAGGYPAAYPPSGRPAGGPGLGRMALLLALLATVVLTIVGAALAWFIGHGIGSSSDLTTLERQVSAGDLSVLTPVRDLVLWVEITSWVATGLGIWALVQGIVAIAKRRGRGAGIGAVIVAVIGPFVYALAGYLSFAIALGIAATGA